MKGNCLISPQRLRKKLPLPATPRVKAHIKSNGRMYGKGDSRGADGSPSPLHELSARLTERGSPGRDHSSIDPQLVARLDSRPDPGAALGTQRRPRPDGHYINGDSSRSALAALARAERSPPPPLRSQPLLALAPCSTSSRENLESDGDVDGDCSNGGVSLTSRNHETPECAVFQSEMAGTTATAVARTIPKVIMSAPRVADVEGVHQRALEKQRIRAAEAAALVRLSPRGRTTLYHPTWYNQELADTSAPDSELVLEYVHGYAGDISRERTGGRARGFGGGGGKASGGRVDGGQHDGAVGVDDNRDQPTGSPNVLWLRTGEIVFPTSAIVVIHHVGQNRQRFFTGHDEASPSKGTLVMCECHHMSECLKACENCMRTIIRVACISPTPQIFSVSVTVPAHMDPLRPRVRPRARPHHPRCQTCHDTPFFAPIEGQSPWRTFS